MSEQIEGTNFMQVVPMSEAEKLKMYMKMPKAEIAKMLVNCNTLLERIKPIAILGSVAYNQFVPGVVPAVSRCADNQKANEREQQFLRIFKWLLGYNNFPSRQEGEGAYYWRTPLSKKLKRLGIDFSKRVSRKK